MSIVKVVLAVVCFATVANALVTIPDEGLRPPKRPPPPPPPTLAPLPYAAAKSPVPIIPVTRVLSSVPAAPVLPVTRIVPAAPVLPVTRIVPAAPVLPVTRIVPAAPVLPVTRIVPAAPVLPVARVFPIAPVVPVIKIAPAVPAEGSININGPLRVISALPEVVRSQPSAKGSFNSPLSQPGGNAPVFREEVKDQNGQFEIRHSDGKGTLVNESGKLISTDDGWEYVIVKEGDYSFTSPEGSPVAVTYIADEKGVKTSYSIRSQ
ncbi:hypothetical protein J437_LFUL002465 [Ladona fulva]|uniref:Cuticle protein n=1 Tax=Ladona fulva TaxID=123851 RepID=A0A8K0KM48_LADFU|nr:hypothetical protein J437_LFUL002465 [Ladona fulva]